MSDSNKNSNEVRETVSDEELENVSAGGIVVRNPGDTVRAPRPGGGGDCNDGHHGPVYPGSPF